MTRKDYIKIANVLKRHNKPSCSNWSELVKDFSEMLKTDNWKFDPDRFLEACLGI